jgi:hypothetical protein
MRGNLNSNKSFGQIKINLKSLIIAVNYIKAPAIHAHIKHAMVPPNNAFKPNSVKFFRWLGAN